MDQQDGRISGLARLPVVKVWHRVADASRGPQTGSTLGYMKTDIHPEYVEAHVRCTCGNEFTTRSTQPEIHVEICSNCHPFYTGKQKLVDTGGRVERFQRRAARRARGDKA
jgi:large subunit ribosomal protein L31